MTVLCKRTGVEYLEPDERLRVEVGQESEVMDCGH